MVQNLDHDYESDVAHMAEGFVEGGLMTDVEQVGTLETLFGPTDISSEDDIINPPKRGANINLGGLFDDEAISSEEELVPGGGKLPPQEEIVIVDEEEEEEEEEEEDLEESASEWSDEEKERKAARARAKAKTTKAPTIAKKRAAPAAKPPLRQENAMGFTTVH